MDTCAGRPRGAWLYFRPTPRRPGRARAREVAISESIREPAAVDAAAGDRPSHIFIVGLSRTGTSLLRSVLNASEDIGIAAGESHYLSSGGRFGGPAGYRDRFARAGDLRTDAGLRAVVDYLYALPGSGFWARLAAEMPRDALERELATSDRTDRALFDLAVRHFAAGRPIAGEKTPEHVRHVPTLLAWFPGARIVHMLRDPRAVYLSANAKEADWIERGEFVSASGRLRRRMGPVGRAYQAVKLAGDYRTVVRLHDRYTREFGDRYALVRFEDLVTDPDGTVRGLSGRLGVAFNRRMLDQVVRNASFSPRGAQGFDPGAAERWRGQLGSMTRRTFGMLCGREMERFGYAP